MRSNKGHPMDWTSLLSSWRSSWGLLTWELIKELLLDTGSTLKKSLFILVRYFWWVFPLPYFAIISESKILVIMALSSLFFISFLSVFFSDAEVGYFFFLKKIVLFPGALLVKIALYLFGLAIFYLLVFLLFVLCFPAFNFFSMTNFLLPCFKLIFLIFATFGVLFFLDSHQIAVSVKNGLKLFFYCLPLIVVFFATYLLYVSLNIGAIYLVLFFLLPSKYCIVFEFLMLNYPRSFYYSDVLHYFPNFVFLNVLFLMFMILFEISFVSCVYHRLRKLGNALFEKTTCSAVALFLMLVLVSPAVIAVRVLQKTYVEISEKNRVSQGAGKQT